MPKYKIILKGDILPQADRSAVLSRMQERFHIDTSKAEKLLQDSPRVIKKDLDEQAARQYVKALTQIGLVCELKRQNSPDGACLEMHKTSSSPSTDACPKCNHPFEDGPVTECPRCGIIVSKYLALQAAANAKAVAPPGKSAEKQSVEGLQHSEAPWSVRFSAGVASLIIPAALVGLIRCITATAFSFKFNKILTQPLSAMTLETERHMAQIVFTYDFLVSCAAVIVLVCYFILGPILKSGTWAQRFADLVIVSAHTGEKPGWTAWPLRAMGSIISVLEAIVALAVICPLTAIPMIPVLLLVQDHPQLYHLAMILPFLLGVFILYKGGGVLFKRNNRSLADKFSGTRQLKRNQSANIDPTARLWVVITIAALLSSGSVTIAHKQMMRFDPAILGEQEHQFKQSVDIEILEKTHRFQTRYHQEHGAYTDDASYLTQKYCDTRGLNGMQNIPYIDAVFDKRLELELTETGYRAELRLKDDPTLFHVYTEVGYQGIKTHEDE